MTESSHRTPAAERTPLAATRTSSVVVERDPSREREEPHEAADEVPRAPSVDRVAVAPAASVPSLGAISGIGSPRPVPAAASSSPATERPPWTERGPFSVERPHYPDRPTVELSESLAPGWFLLLFATSFAALAYLFSAFFADLVIAFMLVGVFRKTYERIKKGVGARPWLASALTTSLITIVVVGPASLLALTIVREARTVYTASQNAFSEEWIAHHAQGRAAVRSVRALVEGLGLDVSAADVQRAITHGANSVKDMVSERASEALSNAFATMLHFCLVALILFYMFVDGERLKRFAFRLSPLPDDEDALLTLKFTAVARAILLGSGISAFLQAAFGAASMMLVGLPSAVLWGSIMALLAFLPVFGPLFVVVPASAYLWLDGRPEAAMLFFAFNVLQHLVVENVVKTRLIGSQMRLHDLLVFLSILGGIAAFGVMGLVYGPLIVTIFTTLSEFYERHYRRVMARAFAIRD